MLACNSRTMIFNICSVAEVDAAQACAALRDLPANLVEALGCSTVQHDGHLDPLFHCVLEGRERVAAARQGKLGPAVAKRGARIWAMLRKQKDYRDPAQATTA